MERAAVLYIRPGSLVNITKLVEKFFLRFSVSYARVDFYKGKHTHASFGDRRTPNPVIACDFEFLTHQIKFYLKMRRPLLPPQMAQHMLIWVKPCARMVELQKNRDRTEKKKKEILNAPVAIHQINGIIPPPP